MSVKSAEKVSKEIVPTAKQVYKQVLIGSDEGPNFAMRRFLIQVGGSMPLHTNTVEHEQYVLGGRAMVVIGSQTHEVKKGDVVFIPAGVPHSYTAVGAEDFEFICVVPNKEDVTKIVS